VEAKQIKVRTLVLAFAAVALVEAGLSFSRITFNPWPRLGIARLFEIGLIVWAVHAVEGNLTFIGMDRARWIVGLKNGVLWSLGFGALSGIVFALLFLAGTNPFSVIRASLPKSPADLFFFFLVGGIVAPVAEEFFFRGVLYGFLRRWGVWVALALSTAAFALTHGLEHGFPLTQVVGGFLFGVAYEMEKNLLVPITIHCLGNLAIFSLSVIA
jgi:hypothetical protein